MRATALDLEGDPSRPNYEYVRPDSENHWSDNLLALVQELWDDGNRQHSEPNSLGFTLPFLQCGCDDLSPPSSVPTRNVGFGELDHYPTPEDEVSEPNNHKRKREGYPSNCPSDTSKHVKLRVSLTLPEFFVEIPETGTVSYLKRIIIQTVTAIVGGTHVDLLVWGNKIIDENKILSETGISHESRLDVILEPKPLQALVSPCPVCCYLPQLRCDIPPPLTRYSPAAAVVHQGTYDTSTDPLFCNSDNEIRDMGPMQQTINSFKIARRRKPEPFSLDEVVKLVEAVEKLGTGR